MKHKRKESEKEQKCAESLTGEDRAKEDQLQELRRTIVALQQQKDELFAKLQRVSADYANFQKRAPRQIADSIAYEKEMIIKTLLPALDNFEHTLQNAHSAENADVLVKGIRIIYDQMLDILKSHGVEQIKSLGEKFDPALHEAVMQKTVPEQQEDVVLEEFQKGYKLNGRTIRPSRVVVNKPTSEQVDRQQEESSEEQIINNQ